MVPPQWASSFAYLPKSKLNNPGSYQFLSHHSGEENHEKIFAAAMIAAIATPAFADDVGVRVGPVGAGATVGESHDRDRTVIKEREPSDRTTVIKEDNMGNRSKTVIHHDND
jgi:hypothetical protein